MRTADSRTARFALRPRERRRRHACDFWSQRGGRAKRLCSSPRARGKVRNFGFHTCGHQKCLVGDRWCPQVLGAKIRNFGADMCGHQRSPAWHVGVYLSTYTCGGQSYVTLASTCVDPQNHPVGWILGSTRVGGQTVTNVTPPPARVDPKVRPTGRVVLGIYTCVWGTKLRNVVCHTCGDQNRPEISWGLHV